MIDKLIPFLIIIAGTWMIQDGIASILHYINTDENWYFHHGLRLVRIAFGILLLGIGWVLYA